MKEEEKPRVPTIKGIFLWLARRYLRWALVCRSHAVDSGSHHLLKMEVMIYVWVLPEAMVGEKRWLQKEPTSSIILVLVNVQFGPPQIRMCCIPVNAIFETRRP